MISIFQRFSALLITIVLLVLVTIIFSINLALRSNIHPGEQLTCSTVNDSCKIYRNRFGIPHIIGKSEQDVYFSLGYTHAQDRLWQMDLMRRVARGKVSKIFGEQMVDADKFFRVLSIGATADHLIKTVSKQSRAALDSYANGVNFFIESHSKSLPFEFDALNDGPNYTVDPWKPADCLAIERLMAFNMSMGIWTDLAIGEIADTLGVAEALQFIPSYPVNSPTVCEPGHAGLRADTIQKKPGISMVDPGLVKELSMQMQNVRQILGMSAMCSGSNCWVMNKHENSRQGLIFANDPHLELSLPPQWYQVHLTCPQFNAVGCTIPGIPGIVSGRNDHVAWGITNMMLDDCDYFFEKVDASNQAYYFKSDGSRARFRQIRDTIEVRNSVSIVFDYRANARSNIISDLHVVKSFDKLFRYPASGTSIASKYALSISWTAHQESDEVLTAVRLLRCTSWKDFTEAVSSWGAPALNFTYADDKGNMGVAPSGLVPVRNEGNANFPHPGWESKYNWQGVRPASALPRIYNPARRYVFSANNNTIRNAPFYLSSLWEPPSRAERIDEMLQEYREYTVRDAQFMQLDQNSPNSKFVLRNTLPTLLRDTSALSRTEYSALSSLTHWDCTMTALDAAPAIYTVFQERLMYNVFTQKISPALYKKYCYVGSLPMRKINEIISDTSYTWFAAESRSGREILSEIITKSFKDGIALLNERLGSDPGQWNYGKLHRLILKHPFHEINAFRSIVSHEVKNVGGDATTLNNALWQIHNPFDVFMGASMRLVTDMEDSVVYSVVPGGTSGQPLDAHYADQIQLWSNGGYIPLSTSRIPHSSFSLFTTITPKRR